MTALNRKHSRSEKAEPPGNARLVEAARRGEGPPRAEIVFVGEQPGDLEDVRVLRDRGRVVASEFCEKAVVTIHPLALLRAPDDVAREKNYGDFVSDLRAVARLL
ncbi:MAG TPA: hypothetical protein VIM61_10680 [Chthoniobacterales bacterium]|jgi:uracil-DNA glycosylase